MKRYAVLSMMVGFSLLATVGAQPAEFLGLPTGSGPGSGSHPGSSTGGEPQQLDDSEAKRRLVAAIYLERVRPLIQFLESVSRRREPETDRKGLVGHYANETVQHDMRAIVQVVRKLTHLPIPETLDGRPVGSDEGTWYGWHKSSIEQKSLAIIESATDLEPAGWCLGIATCAGYDKLIDAGRITFGHARDIVQAYEAMLQEVWAEPRS